MGKEGQEERFLDGGWGDKVMKILMDEVMRGFGWISLYSSMGISELSLYRSLVVYCK